ncbi:MAG TPA: hypothetical protein VNW97_07550 [Candidatus Saccharimonadales bacterium]|nr:hypothetical protein [Candidatus Saccharimonadales bacterium]
MAGYHSRFVPLLLLAAGSLWAQAGRQPGLAGEVLLPQRATETESSRSNWLVTGVRISNDFDDNALSDDRNKQAEMISSIELHAGWLVSRPRFNWMTDYRFGVSRHQQPSANTSQSHLLDTDLQLRLARRLTVHLRNSFLESTNPLDRLNGNGPTSSTNVFDQPNNSLLVTGVRRNSEQAALDLTYTPGRHSLTGIGGSFFMVNYSAPAGTRPISQALASTNSVSGHAFYSQHLAPRYWAGIEYTAQKFQAQSGQAQLLVHNALFTQTISTTPERVLSVFAGPELSTTSPNFSSVGRPGRMLSWSWAGGVIYSWKGQRTSMVANASRRTSDGGGVLGTVRLTGVSIDLKQQLTHRWSALLGASYGHNQLLTGPPGTISTYSAATGLAFRLNRSTTFDVRYWRGHIPAGNTAANTLGDHNRYSVALAYDFQSPLGR